jgi:hypothetical protein
MGQMILSAGSAPSAAPRAARATNADARRPPEAAALGAAAAVASGRAATGSAVQMHGAIGFPRGNDVHWFCTPAGLLDEPRRRGHGFARTLANPPAGGVG